MSLLQERQEGVRKDKELRNPAPIRQPDDMACVSAITTQILYMTRRIDTPDVAAVDRALGRNTNQPADTNKAYLFLLENGLRIHSICAFNESTFIKEGLPYLRDYYGTHWTDDHERYFSPTVVEQTQKQRAGFLDKAACYKEQLIAELREPSIKDIATSLKRGNIVDVTITDIGIVTHAALVYGSTHDQRYRVYDPDTIEPGLRIVTTDELITRCCLKEGIVAIKA